jgi:hypothetical protein
MKFHVGMQKLQNLILIYFLNCSALKVNFLEWRATFLEQSYLRYYQEPFFEF